MVRWLALTLVAVVLATGITWLAMDARIDSQRAELERFRELTDATFALLRHGDDGAQ